jgi:hypothetical protein
MNLFPFESREVLEKFKGLQVDIIAGKQISLRQLRDKLANLNHLSRFDGPSIFLKYTSIPLEKFHLVQYQSPFGVYDVVQNINLTQRLNHLVGNRSLANTGLRLTCFLFAS